MKTKKNGRNIYKMLNAWLRNCRRILAFRGNKRYKGRDWKNNAWRAVEQFLIVFFINNERPSHILKGHTFFFITFVKKFIIQITCNAILYHWHASPAINYGKLLVLFFLKIFPAPTTFSFFFCFAPDDRLRENNNTLTAPIS